MKAVRVYDVEFADRPKRVLRVEACSEGVVCSDEGHHIVMTADQALDLARALQQAAKDHNDISNVDDGA